MINKTVDYSLVKGLKVAFPHIGLDSSKFMHMPLRFWENEDNRKRHIISLAKKLGFDALVAENWRQCPSDTIHKLRNSVMVNRYYNGNLSKCLSHLFPDINLADENSSGKKSFFSRKPQTKITIRQKLVEFGLSKNIDPLRASDWYRFQFREDQSSPEIRSIVQKYFGHSWTKCLQEVFPELHLDLAKFERHALPNNFWKDENNRRRFFINFAKEKGFDPLISENWYSITLKQFEQYKSATAVIGPYRSVSTALLMLFPDIGLRVELFKKRPKRM